METDRTTAAVGELGPTKQKMRVEAVVQQIDYNGSSDDATGAGESDPTTQAPASSTPANAAAGASNRTKPVTPPTSSHFPTAIAPATTGAFPYNP